MKYIYLVLIIFLSKLCFSQLLPSIGLNSVPANTAVICEPSYYLGSFYTSGLAVGATVPDFKLYGLNGDSIILSNELAANKPVVLIAGSLTCPIFRNKVNTINQVIATYGSAIKVFVIYTIEAHPTDTSVYFGYVNVTTQNNNQGVLFPPPATYGDRKQMVDTMSAWCSLNAPVFIDGPCNQWWNTFGPAPNNAYIISPSGVVLKKHGWFDKSPDKIFCDIDNVLGITSGSCTTTTAPGTFSLTVLNSTVSGFPEDLLLDFAKVKNTESVSVTVSVKKLQKNHPAGWQTAFCADVCYSTAEDSIGFTIPPYDSLLFSLDFYTDAIPDSGSVKVGFRNLNKPNNSYVVRFRASTLPADVSLEEQFLRKTPLVSPNPAQSFITVNSNENEYIITLHDVSGKTVLQSKNVSQIDVSNLSNGVYQVRITSKNRNYSSKLIILHQ